jgi:PAS domain S-box-containing protein
MLDKLVDKEFQRIIFDSPSIWVNMLDKNANITLWNKGAEVISGYTQEEVLGEKTIWELLYPNEEYRNTILNEVLKIIKDGKEIIDFETTIVSRDGKSIIMSWNIHDVKDNNENIIGSIAVGKNITKIKEYEIQLKITNDEVIESKNKLDKIVAASGEGIWDWNIKTNEVSHNNKWYEILGLDNNKDFIEDFTRLIHPQDRQSVLKKMNDTIIGKSNYYNSEHRLYKRNGDIIWVLDKGSVVEYDSNNKALRMAGSFSVITKRKEAEFLLKETNDLVEKLTDNVPGAIYQFRLYPDGRTTFPYISNGIEDLYEVSSSDIRKDTEVGFNRIHKDDLEMLGKTIQDSAKSMEEWNIEYRVNLPKKGLRWIHGKSKPEKLEDGSILWCGIINDITEQKHKEKLLYEQTRLASMGEMIGNIAHQWRQPLSIISTAATGMKLQKSYGLLNDDSFNSTCDAINNNAQYLSKTIDDFTNFIKGDRIQKVFNLKDDINSFLHLVEGTIKHNNIDIIKDIDEDININGNENELTQCLINIFNNSKDALNENVKKNRLIFISTSLKNNNAVLRIKDNAGGISNDVLPNIFEPYFTTKHQSQGTGLGLHMSYKLIVDGMNGTIEAKNINYYYHNKSYVGVEFIITLPID